MTEIALQAVELVRRIEGDVSHTLVNGIDLAVKKGEFVAITGPSGSGKSSLLYLLGLLDAPTEGEVVLRGRVGNFRPTVLEHHALWNVEELFWRGGRSGGAR